MKFAYLSVDDCVQFSSSFVKAGQLMYTALIDMQSSWVTCGRSINQSHIAMVY
jgi:hypothetical protein